MTAYRAKLIVERIETRRPIVRSTEVPKEAVYDIVRIEITADNPDVALTKINYLAKAEQMDREARAIMSSKSVPFTDSDDEPDEDDL